MSLKEKKRTKVDQPDTVKGWNIKDSSERNANDQ